MKTKFVNLKMYSRLVICLTIIFTGFLNSFGQTTVYCYPSGASQSTGRVDIYGKYDDIIRVGKGSLGQNIRGWTTFDVSSIPDNATISALELRIDVQVASTSSNHDIDFRRLTLYPNQNSASDVRDDIDNGVCYDCSSSSEGTSIGYKYITLDNDAVSYFQNTALGWNWFGVGMIEYEGNDDDCDIYGYSNSSYKPRLKVTYTIPQEYTVYNAWWEGSIDNDGDNYTQYRKLYFDVDVSSGTNEIWAKIWKEKTNGTSGAWYTETSDFTIIGNDSGDKQYIEVGLPNNELSYGLYNFGIQIYDSETNETLALYDWDDDTDLNNEKFETQVEDTPPPDITITNPSVTPTTVCAGGTINVSCNHYCTDGFDETPNVGYYLSTNTTCSISDTYLGDDGSTICGSDLYDGESETLTIPSRTSPGTYYVCFIGDYLDEVSETNESNNCEYIQITVNSCVPIVNFSGAPTSGTELLIVQFTDQSSNSPTSWSWNFGDGNTSTQKDPTHTYNNAGDYTVSLTATNSYGSDTKIITNYINVSDGNSAPIADFSADKTNITEGETIRFTDQSSNSPTSWSWNFGDGNTSTQKDPTHTYNNAGDYTVSLTATNSYGSDTKTITNYINVSDGNSAPIADFSADDITIEERESINFTDLSTNNPSNWSWSFEEGTPNTSSQKNPTVTYNTKGTFTVVLTVTNNIGTDTETKYNYISVGSNSINNIDKSNSIKTYPNPTNSKLIIETDVDIEHIRIYSLLGSLLYESQFKPEINISTLNEGIYLLKLYSKEGENLKTEKIIVNK